jgi:hypothetical protein
MATIDNKIQAAQQSLEDTRALYNEGQLQYEAVVAKYEQAKVASIQAKSFVDTLKNNQLDASAALRAAAAFAPDPREYNNTVNQPGVNPQIILQQQTNDAIKKLNVAETARRRAEKEVQEATKFLNGVQNRINVILNQLGIVKSGISLKKKAETAKKQNNNKIKQRTKKVKINDTRALVKKNKAAIKALAKSAALYIVSRLLNKEVQKLAKIVQRLGELVDKVNDQIEAIETRQDVLRARVTRDAAIAELNKAERQITNVRNVLRTLETLLTITSLLLRIVLLIPIPPFTPLRITQKITNVILTLDSLTVIVGINRSALDGLIVEVQYQRSRLLPISDIIDQALENNLTPQEIADLLNRSGNYGQLGPIEGVVYRGFTFAIYEENDPRFVVDGNKRRYAVALDRSGFIVLRSQASFTLDPDILVQELKLQIDQQNLEA